MSKKTRLAAGDEMEADRGSRNEWFGRLLIMAVGLIVIVTGGWNFTSEAIGTALVLGPLFEAPEFRVLFKLTVNRVSGKQVFRVEQSSISGSNVVGVAGEVHFHQAPQVVSPSPSIVVPPAKPTEPEWEDDEQFTLSGNDYRVFEYDLEDGDRLVGHVEANGDVSCYVFGRASLRSFEYGEYFNGYWETEDVTRTKVSFVAPGRRKYFFVVDHSAEDEDGEYEEKASVSVKLRVVRADSEDS